MWRQGYIDRDRKFFRCLDAESLVSGVSAAVQSDPMSRYPKGPGKEPDQVGVGFSLYRRRPDAHLEIVAEGACKLVVCGAGLDAQIQYQVLSVPTVPGSPGRHLNGLPVITCSGGISNIFNRISPIMTSMGERSRPDMGGIMRLAGASRGFVKLYRRLAAG